MKLSNKFGLMLFAAAACCGLFIAAQDAAFVSQEDTNGKAGLERTRTHLKVDVAINAFTLIVDPSGGFIVEGFIYPAGTLTGSEGINPDGTAEFPDLVIGRFTCKGWGILPRPEEVMRPGASTTQSFEFNRTGNGNDMITTEGFEMGVGPILGYRAVQGGTGIYLGMNAEQQSSLFAINTSGMGSLRVSFVERYRYFLKD